MLKRVQPVDANFTFQHHPFRRTVEQSGEISVRHMGLWSIAPDFDQLEEA
ncbi:hypothetical protein GGQ64_005046 [Rhizobium azooxidifex]|jgi:protein FrlC|uniref:Uncharacterized protein n=1 Tax=Mycoplana azooxidifex TaxID=1636188 RepID=A0A7W6GL61_9HYPH|nr:hypothetical protein [Mycoplana azooxidifex]MBB3979801.1 hypothetical protein [Mycoplana azooxidifex]